MVCAPLGSIIPSLKLGDYLSAQAHKPARGLSLEPKGAQTMLYLSRLQSRTYVNKTIPKLSPVKLAIFSLNPKQIATKGFFAFLLRISLPI